MKSRRGFTLFELVVVVGLIGVISSFVVNILLNTGRVWNRGTNQASLSIQLRHSLNDITRELADAPVNQVPTTASPAGLPADGNWYSTIVFRYPQDLNADGEVLDADGNVAEWSNWVRYELTGGNVLQRKLSTVPAVTLQPIAGNITLLQFRRQAVTPDVIEIRLTAASGQGGIDASRSLTGRVKLRNLQVGVLGEDPDPPEDF